MVVEAYPIFDALFMNDLLGFAYNNDGFADEALGWLQDVKDQSVREILLKQIRALI